MLFFWSEITDLMTLPATFSCFSVKSQSSVKNLRIYCFCLTSTSVSGQAADWGGKKGTFHGVKTELMCLDHGVGAESGLSYSLVPGMSFHRSVLALSSLSLIHLLPVPHKIWTCRTAAAAALEGFEDVEAGRTSACTELFFAGVFLLCSYYILNLS